jgi:hypothetical protein
MARQGQIVYVLCPAVLPGDNTLDVVCAGTVFLRQGTVFTSVARAAADQIPGRRINQWSGSIPRRALLSASRSQSGPQHW